MTSSSAKAVFNDLLDTLRDIGDKWVGPDFGVTDLDDTAEALRNLSHFLQSGLLAHQEFDPDRPVFNRIVSPTRSFTGDNADAVYFEAPVSGEREYVVRGNIAGAVYTSFTMESGANDGRWSSGIHAVLNDDDIDVDADGNYRIAIGGASTGRNRLSVPVRGGRITTRHYFEWPTPAAASQTLHIPLSIQALEPPAAPGRWDDERVAAALQRVVNHVRSKTLEAPSARDGLPSWVSVVPNQFPAPERPGTMGFAAADAAYSMARFALGPDEALVITGRWPQCRFANVSLWNRFGQMFDYVNRSVSRNRANTALETDGSFRMVVAHRDPGVANWLDTEGRPSGSIFWRFFLPEGPVETPVAQVVPFDSLSRT